MPPRQSTSEGGAARVICPVSACAHSRAPDRVTSSRCSGGGNGRGEPSRDRIHASASRWWAWRVTCSPGARDAQRSRRLQHVEATARRSRDGSFNRMASKHDVGRSAGEGCTADSLAVGDAAAPHRGGRRSVSSLASDEASCGGPAAQEWTQPTAPHGESASRALRGGGGAAQSSRTCDVTSASAWWLPLVGASG